MLFRSLDDDSLRQLTVVRQKLIDAASAVKLRDTEIDRLTRESTDQQARLALSERSLQQRALELEATKSALAEQVNLGRALSEQLAQATQQLPKIGVQALVGQFRQQIDQVNAGVLAQAGGGMLVDSVEVEVRGGLDVDGGLHLTQLPGSALSAAALSTLRFNLRPAATLRIADDA